MRTLSALSVVLTLAACGEAPSPTSEEPKRAEREDERISVAVVKAACGETVKERAEGVAEVADVTERLNGGDDRYGHDVPSEVYELTEELTKTGCP